jgi:group I intron endonuclease
MDHIKRRDSNLKLQRAIKKYGLKSFDVVIYYFHKYPAVLLTDIETTVISAFPFSSLYNFKKEANSMLGYKHTKEAIAKMKLRFLDKKKPVWKKT